MSRFWRVVWLLLVATLYSLTSWHRQLTYTIRSSEYTYTQGWKPHQTITSKRTCPVEQEFYFQYIMAISTYTSSPKRTWELKHRITKDGEKISYWEEVGS